MLVDALIQAHLYAGADLVLVYMSPRTHIQAHVYTGADVVLVDAPCSSLGVIRRHPSLRWELQVN